MVRTMPQTNNNPFEFKDIKKRIEEKLKDYTGQFDVVKVPNITNICYGRDVSYKIEVNLNPGDMLVYKGNILEHWRNAFKGKDCGQVFLHYNNAATNGSEKNKFDGRSMLGLLSNFKK
jgi:hypothetical protein